MILTVTPNPAWDVTYQIGRFVPDESYRIEDSVQQAGGKGINVARVTAAQGFDTTAIAPVSDADAQGFRADLSTASVSFVPVKSSVAVRRSTNITETETGRATVLNEAGRAQPDSLWRSLLDTVAQRIDGASVIVGSGSLPAGAPGEFYAALSALAASAEVPSLIDTSGQALLSVAEAGPWLLKPNRSELLAATKTRSLTDGVRVLKERGARHVLVSDGEAGLRFYSHDGACLTAKLPLAVKGNPTGAGDAVVAAVACLLAEGVRDDYAAFAARAAAFGAAAVLEPVAGRISVQWKQLEDEVQLEETQWA